MKENGPPPIFMVFMAVWVVLGISSMWFFTRSRNARLKRNLHRWGTIATGVVFAGFVVASTGQLGLLLFVGPALVLVSFLNIRMTKFCNACGAMLYKHQWFTPMHFCSRCGAAFEKGDTTRHDGA
jgi:hypothetical protein